MGRPSSGNVSPSRLHPISHVMSPMGQSNDPFDMKSTISALPPSSGMSGRPNNDTSAIRIRNLPFNTDHNQLRTLLTFADSLESLDFLPSSPGYQGTRTAVARFYAPSAAKQAQQILDGKQMGSEKLNIEIMRLSPGSIGAERNNGDSTNRTQSGSSNGSAGRFSGQYHSMSRISPPGVNGYEHTGPSSETYFSPTKMEHRQRVSARDVLGQQRQDDESSLLLRDAVDYPTNDMNGLSRRNTGTSQSNMSRYDHNLSLNTSNPTSPPLSGYASPRHNGMQSPSGVISPNGMTNMAPLSYYNRQTQYPRINMPPVNPADQNPPCNTLYVGNLPLDTSEDELKAMFSKQRGYKRLCFRTKSMGPMCFVEFEDTSFATKALNELYGHPLHNSSTRGGIRLSFSKNPLGVRSGQPGGADPRTPTSPGGPFPGPNGYGMNPFSTATGPPPGIPPPSNRPMVGQAGPNSMTSPPNLGFPQMATSGAMTPNAMQYGAGSFGMGNMNAAMGSANPLASQYVPMNNGWPRSTEPYAQHVSQR